MVSLSVRRVVRDPLWAFEYWTECPHCKRLTRFTIECLKDVRCRCCDKAIYIDPDCKIEPVKPYWEMKVFEKSHKQGFKTLRTYFKEDKIKSLGKDPWGHQKLSED